MPDKLGRVVQAFLNDQKFQTTWNERIKNRSRYTPNLRKDILDFSGGKISLVSFRNRLNVDLPKQAWDSTNKKNSREWLLAELTTLIEYHDTTAETQLRYVLTGLNANNIGERVELFHDFLTTEKVRFHKATFGDKGRPMAPLNSALMITLFASMLDPTIYFCDVYLRRGIAILLNYEITEAHIHLTITDESIEIRTYHDYQRVKNILDNLLALHPNLKVNSAWAEIFTRWLLEPVNKKYL